ncbi:hypothetical protein [Oribacterium sp. FC2011]|uniref:hypothetical protein n=1 Tax=Oribacterium sp. FC2011 TaxID=1408311 RepID=UPI0004E0D796|nr:hypothetical protein [Oribacterium sp. FC2011]
MIYYIKEMEEDFLNDFVYWSDNHGQFEKDGKDLSYDELPKDLQSVYSEIWEENKDGLSCCLAEFKGEYGIALVAEYSRSSQARDLEMAKRVAKTLEEKKTPAKSVVILAYDLGKVSDNGDPSTVVILFLPSSVSKKTFNTNAKIFGDMAYKAEKQTLYKEYKVPFVCELYGRIVVKAKNQEEAKQLAAKEIAGMAEEDIWKNTTLLRNTLKVDERSKVLEQKD